MISIRAARARDVYWQRFVKYPGLAMFQSRVELLHAALLEGDAAVTSFVPHPFRLRACARDIPGCYLIRDGRRVVRVITAPDVLSEPLRQSLREFFASHRMRFEVVTEASILARETQAQNWLYIVRRLVENADLDTHAREATLLRRLRARRRMTLAGLLGERAGPDEIALFRLLHRGAARARLEAQPLHDGTLLSLPE